MLKPNIRVTHKRGVYYLLDAHNAPKRFTPWLGDWFAWVYDAVMRYSVFPKKFRADLQQHVAIVRRTLQDIHQQQVLELAAGNGRTADTLPPDNHYIGTDISPGLLRRAVRRFRRAGFQEAECYVVSADNLPFAEDVFDLCLCHLSFNFFENLDTVFQEVQRVLKPGARFLGSVPVPERHASSTIRGTLYSAEELGEIAGRHGFGFEALDEQNGALLYFQAVLPASPV